MKKKHDPFTEEIKHFGIPKTAFYGLTKSKHDCDLMRPAWGKNLNKFDYLSKNFRYVVALSPIKTKIRHLEVCVTDCIAVFKDYSTPVFWSINEQLKRKDGAYLRVLFPGEAAPRLLPVEQVKLYNAKRYDDRALIAEYNSYAADITEEKNKIKFNHFDFDAVYKYLRYLYHINRIWKKMRSFKKLHIAGTNAVFTKVMM